VSEEDRKPRLLRRLWAAWRRVLEREEAHWREGVGESVPGAGSGEACGGPAKTSTLDDLVRERQSEVRHDGTKPEA